MKKSVIALLITVSCFLGAVSVSAFPVNDGFRSHDKFETEHFSVEMEKDVVLDDLHVNLAVPESIRMIIKEPLVFDDPYSLEAELDTLFWAVSEIMDIYLPDFKVDVKVCADIERIKDITGRLFGRSRTAPGFYVSELNTIYVSSEDISLHVFGHELAHALQCNYFVVPPPEKLQEVLSGYVEYQFRKYTDSVPVEFE